MYSLKSTIIYLLLNCCAFQIINSNVLLIGQNRIFGGRSADSQKFPYQAALALTKYNHLDGNYSSFCSGSLITTKYVLTAAQCLVDCVNVGIGLGTHSSDHIEHSYIYMESTDLRPHKGFDNSVRGKNDIGLVKLPETVTLSENIAIVQLPLKTEGRVNYYGYKGIISGWGVASGTHKLSQNLKFLHVDVIAGINCTHFHVQTRGMICALGVNDGRVCQGDAGGPLVTSNSDGTLTQIGILSIGDKYCLEGEPNVYTKITRFLNWIAHNSDYQIRN